MIFFQSKPDVSITDKARLEFRLQQIADCIGADKFLLPVLSLEHLLPPGQSALDSTLAAVTNHLGVDFSGFKIQESLNVIEQKSGGGG